jgi:hypothetical protein
MVDPDIAPQILNHILDMEISSIKVHDLLALSSDLQKEMVETTCTVKVSSVNAALFSTLEVSLNFTTPL